MHSISLRQADAADACAIARVHVASWRESYRGLLPDAYLAGLDANQREASWRNALDAGAAEIWIAEEQSELAGWVAFGDSRETDPREPRAGARVGEIWALYLLREYWGRGIGSMLMQRACERLAEDGFLTLILWVFARNQRARDFYEKCGFEADLASLRWFELADTPIEELRYTRILKWQ